MARGGRGGRGTHQERGAYESSLHDQKTCFERWARGLSLTTRMPAIPWQYLLLQHLM